MIETFPIFLRIDKGTWSRATAQALPRRTLTVLGAFTLAAWNRFGSQAFLGPRAPVRMILTGIYGWLALSLVVWFIATRIDPELLHDRSHSIRRALVAVTVAHFPLIIIGFYIATFGAFIRSPWPGTIIAILTFSFWIPTLLTRALQHLVSLDVRLDRGRAMLAIAVPYIVWLLIIGRYLFQQVGHLL